MVESGMGALWCTALLALASAGPLARFPRDVEDYQSDLSAYVNFTANEVCFSDNEVFQKGAQMPNPGPCEECRCEPPSIVCNMIKCPVNNNGCRTLQKPNHCCHDYNCECHYNGQLYNDGELVDVPEQPCQVCYCKGGDVMCNSLKCYQRDDCPPTLVPGQCCPKYENCPVRDTEASEDKNNQTRLPNKTLNNPASNEMQPWLLTKSVMQTSSLPLPKPVHDTTTEDGNTVIVSDWLTERRTTTENAANQEGSRLLTSEDTDGPTVITDSAYKSTLQQQKTTKGQEESSLVMTPGTLTPLDEVIFTRIDMLQVNHEGNMALSTSAPLVTPEDAEVKLHQRELETNEEAFSLKTNKEEVTTRNILFTTDDVISLEVKNETTDMVQNKHALHSNTLLKEDLTSTTVIDTTDTTTSAVQETDERETIEGAKQAEIQEEQSDNDYNAEPTMKNPFNNSANEEISNQSNKVSQEENIKKDTDSSMDFVNDSKDFQLSEEITLEHLFGLDKSDIEETDHGRTEIEISTVKDETSDRINIALDKMKSDLNEGVINNKEDQERLESFATEESIHGDSLHKETNTENNGIEVEKSKIDKITSSIVDKIVLKLEETPEYTENSLEEMDTTTPYFTEDHMSGLIPESDKLLQGNKNTDKGSSKYDEFTTESVKFTILTEPEITREYMLIKETNEPNTEIGTDSSNIDMRIDDVNNSDPMFSTPQYPSDNDKLAAISLKDDKTYDIQEVPPYTNAAEDNSSNANQLQTNEATEKSSSNLNLIEFSTKEGEIKDILKDIKNQSDKEKEGMMAVGKDEFTNDDGETIGNVPPVLELNSHVPFLQLGGQGTSDSSSDVMDEFQLTTTASTELKLDSSKRFDRFRDEGLTTQPLNSSNNDSVSTDNISNTATLLLTEKNEINSKEGDNQIESKEDSKKLNLGIDATPPTSHIPLTPGDLKVLAEYLIKEKIIPAITINSSTYTPNPWLKGNLTSEEKMASIMSAANVSIGIMNQTYSGTKVLLPETSTRTNEIIRPEKYEKEAIFKGNSILDSGSASVNKTGYFHNKHDSNKVFQKPNLLLQSELDDAILSNNDITTDSTSREESSFMTDATTESQTDDLLEITSLPPSPKFEKRPQHVKTITFNNSSNDINIEQITVDTFKQTTFNAASEDATQPSTIIITEERFRPNVLNESVDLNRVIHSNVQPVSEISGRASQEELLRNSITDRESLESTSTVSINNDPENSETTKTQ